MTVQLSLWSDLPTDVQTSKPWPLGVWLRAYKTSLHDDNTTIIGRLTAYDVRDDQVYVTLVNAVTGATVPVDWVVGVISPEGRPRTGFPKTCPTGQADPVLTLNCEGCEHRRQDERGYWRCDHVSYQVEPGAHFCLGCGVTLGPWAESHGWWYCGGPTGRCLKIQGKSIELQDVPFRSILSGDLFWDAEREQWQKEGTDKAMRLSDYREREFEQDETVFVNDYINQ